MKKLNILLLVTIFTTHLISCDNSNFKSSKALFTVDEVYKLSNDKNIAFIDVRSANEVKEESYKISNITNIPLDNLEDRIKEIPRDKQVILLCESGNRSQKAYNVLKEKGFINMANMEDGIIAWKDKNYPINLNSDVAETEKKACCADPKSSDCNPDGTCKPSEKKKEEKECCPK